MRADERASAPPAPCRCLRTKTAFGSVVGEDPWETGESATAAYWCLSTMEPVGPDQNFVHPHVCHGGRGCYRSSAD
jgi:hypothetical protein